MVASTGVAIVYFIIISCDGGSAFFSVLVLNSGLHTCYASVLPPRTKYILNPILVLVNNQENKEGFWKIRWAVTDTAGMDGAF